MPVINKISDKIELLDFTKNIYTIPFNNGIMKQKIIIEMGKEKIGIAKDFCIDVCLDMIKDKHNSFVYNTKRIVVELTNIQSKNDLCSLSVPFNLDIERGNDKILLTNCWTRQSSFRFFCGDLVLFDNLSIISSRMDCKSIRKCL